MDELFGDKPGRNTTDAELLWDCMLGVGLLRVAGVEKRCPTLARKRRWIMQFITNTQSLLSRLYSLTSCTSFALRMPLLPLMLE
jgi:hypothetical protein